MIKEFFLKKRKVFQIFINMNKLNTLFHRHFKLQDPHRILKSFSQQTSSCVQQKQILSSNEDWIPIYYFKHIRLARTLNRFKLYQTVLTGAAVPAASIMYYYNEIDFSILSFIVGCGTFACCTLYPITWFFRRLVGIIYMSHDDKFVKISHLTFWGNRKNIIVPSEQIIPLTDSEHNINDAFVKLQRQDVADFLYFSLKYGEILQKSKFQTLFGDVSTFRH